jgi:hypothetical protein
MQPLSAMTEVKDRISQVIMPSKLATRRIRDQIRRRLLADCRNHHASTQIGGTRHHRAANHFTPAA